MVFRTGLLNSRGLAILAVFIALIVSGCQTTTKFNMPEVKLGGTDAKQKILLMPLDVELSELTAGGINEPKAEWTENAKKHIKRSVRTFFSAKGVPLTIYNEEDISPEIIQITKLNMLVSQNIWVQKYINLPTQKDNFDWPLGEDIKVLRARYDADYALFLYMRDSYASSGRVAVMFLSAALGAGVRGGVQIGYVTLVDLGSGKVVWFNNLARQQGDLRKWEPAQKTVSTLFSSFPE
jgi:hypothetical protein